MSECFPCALLAGALSLTDGRQQLVPGACTPCSSGRGEGDDNLDARGPLGPCPHPCKVTLSQFSHVTHLQVPSPLASWPSLQGLSSWQVFLLARTEPDTLVPQDGLPGLSFSGQGRGDKADTQIAWKGRLGHSPGETARWGWGQGEDSCGRSPHGLVSPSKPLVTSVAGPGGECASIRRLQIGKAALQKLRADPRVTAGREHPRLPALLPMLPTVMIEKQRPYPESQAPTPIHLPGREVGEQDDGAQGRGVGAQRHHQPCCSWKGTRLPPILCL